MSEQTPTPEPGADSAVAQVGAVTYGGYTLIIADFADPDLAQQAYAGLKDLEDGRTLEVEGAIVVTKSEDGTLTVQEAPEHSTRRGATWGAIGGAVLGIIFPPSIIGSAIVAGLVGAAAGKGANVRNKHRLAEEMQESIDPGHSGIIALVSDPGAVKIMRALEKADRVVQKAVDEVAVADIRAAAQDAEAEATR